MQNDENLPRAVAWLVVAGVHATMLWLFTLVPRSPMPTAGNQARTQLVLIARPQVRQPPTLRAATRTTARPAITFAAPPPGPSIAAASQPSTPAAEADPGPAVVDWQQQAQDWAHRQAPLDATAFAADPLRSRRARLPGGEQAERIRMTQPIAPAQVARFVGKLFGDPGPPCPRVRSNISGLLTATSERERELLAEELRQYRDYCQP